MKMLQLTGTGTFQGRVRGAMGMFTIALTMLAAGAQGQCLITDFEGLGSSQSGLYLFRRPNFSGSTAGFVVPGSDSSRISGEQAHSGVSSLKVQWTSTAAPANWLRLTTFQSGAVPAVFPNPQLRSSDVLSFWIYVPSTTPDFYVSVGVRESPFYAGCGQNGGVSGSIEWLGATSRRTPGGPLGKLVNTKDQWVQLTFAVPCEPVLPFVGNGVLNVSQLVLEHLAITPVTPGDIGPFVMYLDDFAVEPFPMVEFLSPVPQLQVPHQFAVGETIPIMVQLRGCEGEVFSNDVTVKLDVQGLWWGYLFDDVNEVAVGIGDTQTKRLSLVDDHFQFNLGTFGFARGTSADDRYYSAQVTVTENAHGVEVGRGSVVLESK